MISKKVTILTLALTLLLTGLLKAEHISGKLYFVDKANQDYTADFRVHQDAAGIAQGQFRFKIPDGETKIDIQ